MGRRHRTRPSRYAGRKKEDYSVEEGCLVALFVKIPLALCFAMFTAKNPEDRMLAGGGLAIFIGAFLLAWMGVSSKVLYGIVIWAIVALLLFVFTAKKKNPSKGRLSNEEKPVSLPRQNSVPKACGIAKIGDLYITDTKQDPGWHAVRELFETISN